MHPDTSPTTKKSGRARKNLLTALLSLYALMGWLRLVGTLRLWDYLEKFILWPRPLYLAVSGGLIGFLFSLAIILFLAQRKLAPRFSRVLALLFLIWFWVDRIWLSTRAAFFVQLEASLLITLTTLFWAFGLIKKKDFSNKKVLQEADGQQTGTGSQILSE